MDMVDKKVSEEIARKIEGILSKSGYTFSISNIIPYSDTVRILLDVKVGEGVPVAAITAADSYAKSGGLAFKGHFIGSVWKVKCSYYTVADYVPRRKRYPVSLRREDGRLVKASILFLARGEQVYVPDEKDFIKWFTLDPDSDAILESDAEICDKVQAYMERVYPGDDGQKFFSLVDEMNERGVAHKWAGLAYSYLFERSYSVYRAYAVMEEDYKNTLRK